MLSPLLIWSRTPPPGLWIGRIYAPVTLWYHSVESGESQGTLSRFTPYSARGQIEVMKEPPHLKHGKPFIDKSEVSLTLGWHSGTDPKWFKVKVHLQGCVTLRLSMKKYSVHQHHYVTATDDLSPQSMTWTVNLIKFILTDLSLTSWLFAEICQVYEAGLIPPEISCRCFFDAKTLRNNHMMAVSRTFTMNLGLKEMTK